MNEQEFSRYKDEVEDSLKSSSIGDWILKQQRLGFTPWQILSAMVIAGWEDNLAQGLIERMLVGSVLNPAHRPPANLQSNAPVNSNGKVLAPTLNWIKEQKTFIPRLQKSEHNADAGTRCQIVSHYLKPEIVFMSDFLSPQEVEHFKNTLSPHTDAAKPHFLGFKQAFVTSKQLPDLEKLTIHIADLFTWARDKMDAFQVSTLPKNAYIEPHYDFFNPDHPDTKLLTAKGGQRIASFIIFLETAAAGGAIQFPELGITHLPEAGSAIFFSYPELSGASRTLNGMMPVLEGKLTYLSTWFRTESV